MKVVWYPAITLDGYIAKPNGDSNWVIEEDEKLFEDEVKASGCTIVGRTTYEQYAGEIYPIPDTTTYIVTTNPANYQSTDKIKYVPADAKQIIKTIESDGFNQVILSGGGETNGLFASAGAIDEAIISMYPYVLGKGIRMFGSRTPTIELELISTTDLGKGVIQNRYNIIKNGNVG